MLNIEMYVAVALAGLTLASASYTQQQAYNTTSNAYPGYHNSTGAVVPPAASTITLTVTHTTTVHDCPATSPKPPSECTQFYIGVWHKYKAHHKNPGAYVGFSGHDALMVSKSGASIFELHDGKLVTGEYQFRSPKSSGSGLLQRKKHQAATNGHQWKKMPSGGVEFHGKDFTVGKGKAVLCSTKDGNLFGQYTKEVGSHCKEVNFRAISACPAPSGPSGQPGPTQGPPGGNTYPAAGGNTSPAAGGGNTYPAAGGNTSPANGGNTYPAGGGPGNTYPTGGGNTSPAAGGGNTYPTGGGNTHPGNGGNPYPTGGGNTHPGSGGNTYPASSPGHGGGYPTQPPQTGYPTHSPTHPGGSYPTHPGGTYPTHPGGTSPTHPGGTYPTPPTTSCSETTSTSRSTSVITSPKPPPCSDDGDEAGGMCTPTGYYPAETPGPETEVEEKFIRRAEPAGNNAPRRKGLIVARR